MSENKIKAYVYDVETYLNFFCLSASPLDSDEVVQFVIDDTKNQRKEIMSFFKGIWAIGYNNHGFDDIIINYIIDRSNITAQQIAKVANEIISLQRTDEGQSMFYRIYGKYRSNDRYKSLDLIRMLFPKKLRVGLKELECSLNHDNVEELPYEPNTLLNPYEKEKVLAYNINDILATKLVLKNSLEALQLRKWAKKAYNVDGYSMDGVTLGMKIFERLLGEKLGNYDFTEHRTIREEIAIKDILVPCLEFKTPEFQAVLKRYQNLVISKKDYEEELLSDVEVDPTDASDIGEERPEVVKKFKWEPKIFGHKFKYGVGGLHKDVLKGAWRTTETHRVVSVDVASYYPNIIIKWRFKPAHLPDEFYAVYQEILDERLVAKGAGETLKAETLKLSVNGFFGNTNNKFSWGYDLRSQLGTTINGQLMLSMLCEDFLMEDFELIDANTDGIYLRYPVEKHERYTQIIKDWERKTQMVLEETEFKEIYFLTTADYFGVPAKGKPKDKGLFIETTRVGKGMEFPIIAKAVKKYFLEGLDYSEVIKSCDDILQFCSYRKLNKKFTCYWKGEVQQRVNRFYASRCGASLFKRKWNEKRNKYQTDNILRDSPVQLLNKIEKMDINDRCINYAFYNAKARDIIFTIEGNKNQMSLFNERGK